ncbi:MAG: NUDIX hydrolase [Candidatus Aenigmarchaeota archaeon]|nr:NUDIX hydrolase [Candidatus Aenigmarchaeota archaeon]
MKYIPEKLWKKIMKTVPRVVVDGVVMKDNKVLLLHRKFPPYLDHDVLPGGFVEYGETAEKAVVREVWEETGLRTKVVGLSGVYSDPKRDPRGHLVTVAFLLSVTGGKIRESSETKNIRFFSINKLPKKMGFDHTQIVKDALKLSSSKK